MFRTSRHFLGSLAVALAGACHAQGKLERPELPEAIRAPQALELVLVARAQGVQIYACQPKSADANAFEWTLKAPAADLFDEGGAPLGRHYAGPTWEARDGSKLVGTLKAKVDAPSATAIPWLLLEAKTNEGNGVLGRVRSVQRVDTVGGKAPGDGCDAAHAGAETRVPYQAKYYFYAQ